MHPATDPWESTDPLHPDGPDRVPSFARASAPVPVFQPPAVTQELPAALVPASPVRSSARTVSWQRASRASRRSLADGWGFSATGLIVAFSGWGVWAAALRGTGSSLMTGFVFMLVVAAGLFGLARFFGYLVVYRILGRPRLHARWAHFLTGLFLTVCGISYLINTTWLTDAGDWLRDVRDWIGQQWPRS